MKPGFEQDLVRGVPPIVEIVWASANTRAAAGLGRVNQILGGFSREQVQLRLAWRGVAPALLQPLQLESRDLAEPRARAAQAMAMLPFAVLMAMLYGAMNAAPDGEKCTPSKRMETPLITGV